MTLTLNTNVSAIIAQKNINSTQNKLATTLERLSSGRRINNAKDDAAGLAIAESMTSRIRGLNQGARNGNDGISLIQTAESGLNQVLSNAQRMRELASQAATGTYDTDDLANIDIEFQALKDEIDRIANITEFNGIQLLDGTVASVDIQVGSENTANDRLTITLSDGTTATLGIDLNDVTSNANAQTALDALNTAVDTITSSLAEFGASHSNLEAAVSGNIDRSARLSAARSQIMDTDYALESSNLAQNQIKQQAGVSMLAQANISGQYILNLLQ